MTVPRADRLAAGLAGRPLHTYLYREARIVRIDDRVVVIADDCCDDAARVSLADVQAGLDRLEGEGVVPVTIAALGPSATYVAAMLVEVDGAAYGDAPARVIRRPPSVPSAPRPR